MRYFWNFRYGLPVNFQAILIHPNKKSIKRLRDVLNQLYSHLDGSASAPSNNADVSTVYFVRSLQQRLIQKIFFRMSISLDLVLVSRNTIHTFVTSWTSIWSNRNCKFHNYPSPCSFPIAELYDEMRKNVETSSYILYNEVWTQNSKTRHK